MTRSEIGLSSELVDIDQSTMCTLCATRWWSLSSAPPFSKYYTVLCVMLIRSWDILEWNKHITYSLVIIGGLIYIFRWRVWSHILWCVIVWAFFNAPTQLLHLLSIMGLDCCWSVDFVGPLSLTIRHHCVGDDEALFQVDRVGGITWQVKWRKGVCLTW